MTVADARLALESMARLAVRQKEICLITRDRSGGWRHRYPQGTLVGPSPGISWRVSAADTVDIFCHGYTPRPGDTVVEVGAGCGTESVTLSRMVGPQGRVYAVEASPFAVALLRKTVIANRLDNVVVIPAAVTDAVGTVSISERGGPGDIRNTLLATDGGTTHDVPSVTLDALVAELALERIDLLKVNIEGAEKLLVRGMHSSVPKIRHAVVSCHDFLADETGEDDFRSRKQVYEFLTGAGFELSRRPDDPRPWVRDYLYATA